MAADKKIGIVQEVAVPAEVSVQAMADGTVSMKGPKGENSMMLRSKRISLTISASAVQLAAKTDGKRDKKMIGTFRAHLKNLIKGVTEGYVYHLKICSEHFPMNVTITGTEIIVKNLLGEHHPRIMKLPKDVKVEISGSDIVVKSTSKEAAGQCAASIERLTARGGFDRRIFQDGIFITKKAAKGE